jgi:hypothetical protein
MCKAIFVGMILVLLSGCIAPPNEPVGKVEQALANASLTDIFARDLQFIYEEIRDNYVNLAYKEQTFGFSWDELYFDYADQLGEVQTHKDFFRLASSFVSELRDGHVMFSHHRDSPETERETYDFNSSLKNIITVRLIEETPIIVESLAQFPIVGAEVLEINGISFAQLVKEASQHFYFGATDQAAITRVLANQLYFEYLALISQPFPAELEITFRTSDGRRGDMRVNSQQDYPATPRHRLNDLRLSRVPNRYPFYEINDKIAHIVVPTFDVNIEEFYDRVEQIVAELKETDINGVIFDLRGNGGGNESFRDLLSYLVSEEIVVATYRYRQSPRMSEIYGLRPLYENLRGRRIGGEREQGYSTWYHWKVQPNGEEFFQTLPKVVLTDRLVFSSADGFVGTVMQYDLATVVGTEVALTGHGLPTPVLLPSGHYVMNYSFQELRDPQFGHIENVVKQPHILVEQTLEDYYQGIDTVLETAIRFLSKIE